MKNVVRFRAKIIENSLIGFLLILCFASVTQAQTESARLQGTVTDASGAIVPNATVKATNAGTNRVVSVQSNEEGVYSVLSLSPGIYKIEVSIANFKTIRQEVRLEVAQVATLNFALEAGDVSAVVDVSTDAPLVESGSSAIGEVIQGRQVVELPLNGRNVLELARLTPGVTQGVPGGFATGVSGNAETFRGRNTGGAALSVNGQRTQANNFLLDGVDNNESLVNTIQIFPQADAVQEFRVQTSVSPAEFGRGGGAIINSTIKSGRNDFFGSVFWFVRNDNLDARPTFTSTKSEFRRNQFGGTVGGPIWKDKIFFFADYEGIRQFLPLNRDIATVPTEAFRRGDFSALLNPAISGLGAPIQLRDPLTGLNVPNNRLDLLAGNRLNGVGLNYLKAFPLPNRGGTNVLSNYETVRNEILEQNSFDIRVDSNINDNNQIFGRVSYGKAGQETTSRLPALPAGFGSGTNFTRTRALALGLNTTLTETFVNELRVSASRINFGYQPPFFENRVSADLGIPGANPDPLRGGGALIGGFNGQLEYTGDFGLYTVPQNTYQIVDSMGLVRGNHTIRFGGTILRREVNLFRPNRGKGYFFLFGNGDNPASTGFEQADLLIGFVNNYQVGPPFGTVGTRNWENAFFIQDDWRATNKLTFNFGIRYEYFTNPSEVYGRQANFDLNSGRLIVASDGSDPLVENDKNDFSPRVGFAYNFDGSGKTVLRGGYGLFYFLDRGGIDNQLAQNPPYSGFSQFDYSNGFRITLSGRGPNGNNDSRLAAGALPGGNVSGVNLNNPQNVSVLTILPDNKTSNVHQFNVQVQRQLTNDTALSVGYVGTRGRNLSIYHNANGNIIGQPNAPRKFPNLGDVRVRDDRGKSQYDSLQVQLERRFSNGWQYLASYTFSKTRDDGAGAFDSSTAGNLILFEDFARSNIDFPHVFSFSSIYEIPFGRGRKYGSDIPKALDAVIGGWQVNGVLRLQSGQAFDVRRSGVLVDVTGEPYGNGSPDNFLRRAAFNGVTNTNGIPLRIGNLERNSLRSPSTKNINLGISKNFSFTERLKLQFRTEFFNLTNTPQYGVPNTNIDDAANFGRIQGTHAFTNRQIQFGLRLVY